MISKNAVLLLAKVSRSARDWHRNTAMDGLPARQQKKETA